VLPPAAALKDAVYCLVRWPTVIVTVRLPTPFVACGTGIFRLFVPPLTAKVFDACRPPRMESTRRADAVSSTRSRTFSTRVAPVPSTAE